MHGRGAWDVSESSDERAQVNRRGPVAGLGDVDVQADVDALFDALSGVLDGAKAHTAHVGGRESRPGEVHAFPQDRAAH
jgi:hypothetical protein